MNKTIICTQCEYPNRFFVSFKGDFICATCIQTWDVQIKHMMLKVSKRKKISSTKEKKDDK